MRGVRGSGFRVWGVAARALQGAPVLLPAQGFAAVAVAANILFFFLFRAGKKLSGPMLRWRDRKAKAE